MDKERLIEVSVTSGEYSVSVKVPKEAFYTNPEKIINALKNCLLSIVNNDNKIEFLQPPTEQPKNNVVPIVPQKDDFKIRERIPNNVVDIKDLDIKQAVTEKALVRCPNCGQAHVLAVNAGSAIYMMRRFYSATGDCDEFRIIAEFNSMKSEDLFNMSCKPDTDRKAYFEDIQSLKMIDDKDFAVTNDTEVFCPVCCKSDTFFNWKNAYENPLEYFETEHLCDVCGGETITRMIKEQKVYECEICGHKTDYKED